MKPQTMPETRKAPDPILAELWETKRQINAEAGYRIDELVRMAHEAALLWQSQAKSRQEGKST